MLHLNQPAIKKIELQAHALPEAISLAQGALRIGGVSIDIKHDIASYLATDKADYYGASLGLPALREKIATFLNKQYGTSLSDKHLFVSHGSINSIAALCLMLLETDDEVLIPTPTYPPYSGIVQLAKGIPRFIDAYQLSQNNSSQQDRSWFFDMDRIKRATSSKTKMIVLSHPSNPLGVCLSDEELTQLTAWCEQHDIYLIIDEAYELFFV